MAENPYIDLAKQEDPPANPYIALAQQSTAQEAQQAVAATADRNPDVEANLQSLAARYNLPVEAVRLELPKIERKATIDAIDYEILARDNPKTAGFLRDPAKAAIARDDLEALKQLENQFGTLQQIYGPQPGLVSVVKGLLSSFVTGGKLTREGIRAQAGDLFGSAEMAQDAIRRAEQARFEQSLTDPQFQSSTAQGLYSGGQSLLQQIPSLTAAIALRNPNIAIGAAGAQTQTEAYTRYRARGATPGEASFGATVEGAIEVATEKLPMDFLVKSLGKTGATKFLMEYFVKEGLTEQAATLAQDAIDTAIANPEKTWGDYFAERPDAAYQTALATLVSSGVLGAANAAALRLSSKERQAQAAREAAAALEQVNKLAAASKVLQRKPEAFEQFIEQAAEGGPVTDVYIDTNQLAQSGVDVAALAQVSPSVAAQLTEAQATGSLIKVPVAEYASKIAPTELAQPLTDIIKTDPLGMSRAEAEEFFQTQGDQLKAEVERLLTDKQQDDTFKQSRDAVYKNVLDQLTTANRFTADVNAPYATLMANFYSVMASRMGQTPEQMFQQFPVKIAAEQAMAGAQLDQPAMTTDRETYWHGSVSGDLRGGASGLHLGTKKAATQALEARIGVPASGTWDGSREYGKTLLAGRKSLERIERERGLSPGSLLTGQNASPPEEDYYVSEGTIKYADGTATPLTVKPSVKPFRLKTRMTNTREKPHDDFKANGYMSAALKKGSAKSGYYYSNVAEDAGSVSVVVPNGEHVEEVTEFDQEANGSTPYTEPTITINGVEKPTTNSNGQPIAATQEGLENFWRWFGDSKVVDGDGKPLVVYHGTHSDFDTFQRNTRGVLFVTPSAEWAADYLEPEEGRTNEGAAVMPLYVAASNPFDYENKKQVNTLAENASLGALAIAEIKKGSWSRIEDRTTLRAIKSLKFDGVYVEENGVKNLGVFDPTQIKSVNNRGTFSPDNPNILYQSAYHGSPHRFEKFDLSKIGSGEGAQVQGWGIYFAERESVGRYYFESLGGAERPIQRVLIGSLSFGERDGFDYSRKAGANTLENIRASLAEDVMIEQSAMIEAADAGKFPEFVLDILDRKIEDYKQQEWEEGVREGEKLRRMLSAPGALSLKLGEPSGNLYKLDIPDEAKARMLDWDAPLNQQPQSVQDALAKSGVLDRILKAVNTQRQTLKKEPVAGVNDLSGEAIYQYVSRLYGDNSDKEASLYLNSLGIPGVIYWDGKSRADQDGHRNIVVWSQDVLDKINESVDTLYQSVDTDPDASPWYYSQVQKVVENLKMSKAPGEQWLKTIQNTPGVKQEELDWMGLPEWLAAQEGPITKASLLEYVQANQITVDEVVKGESKVDEDAVLEEADRRYEQQVNDILDSMDVPSAYIDDSGENDEGEPLYVVYLDGDYIDETTDFDLAERIRDEAYADAYKEARSQAGDEVSLDDIRDEVRDEMEAEATDETKFEQWQLPRGQNYRELLLTLPTYRKVAPYTRGDLKVKPDEEGRDKWYVEVPAQVRTIGIPKTLAPTGEDAIQYILDQKMGFEGKRTSLIGGAYTSSAIGAAEHFDEPNIMAHIRFNERRDADGKRVLFIEEIQSDWHQAGREKGYDDDGVKAPEFAVYAHGSRVADNLTEEQAKAEAARLSAWDPEGNYQVDRTGYDLNKGVPDAPFKTTWPDLAFKRALRWAVDNGFDRVAWTTGEQQVDRYDLSKQVDEIRYVKNDDGTYNIVPFKDGEALHAIEKENVREGQLEDFFGKDVAKRIIEGKGDGDGAVKSLSGENLKVGGEGMRAFYDKMLPDMVNKMVKKWGGKVGETRIETGKETGRTELSDVTTAELEAQGIPREQWAEYLRGAKKLPDRAITPAVHSLDITPAMRESVKAGLALFQEKRGAFNPSTSTITLLKAADLSTFLHESGHFFLETMNKLALAPNAPADIKSDMDTILKWFGVGSLVEWNAKTLEQQRDSHEKFARGFEAYLFEGKSPSVEMDGIFKKFRAWLLNVYRSLTSLKVELNDEVRGVFNRMLATTAQIKEAEASRSMLPMFVTAEDAGMTPDEFKAYYETGLEATQEAITNLETRSLRDMKWLGNAKGRALKALQKEAAARRKTVQEEVTREVLGEPVNQARQFLKRGTINGEKVDGPFKMDNAAAKEIAQASGIDFANIEGKYGKYGLVAEGGLAPDVVAEMFGFPSGSELLLALSTAEDVKAKIEGMTDQRMLERYGDLNSPEAIEQAANAAIHNDARARFVATELNALQKAMGSRKVLASAAKDYAAAMVNRQRIRELRPSRYEAAEARAAKASVDAFKKGDTQTAAAEKKNQLVQTYAAKAAYEAQERIEKRLGYLKKFTKDSIRKAVDPDYVDQIQALLERFDLKQRSLKDIDKRASLVEWAAQQQALGLDPDIPPEMLNEANRKNYKDMTVEEFDGLVDTVRQIEHLGRLKNKLLTAADQRQFDTAISEMTARIRESSDGKVKDNRTRATFGNWVYKGFAGAMAEHRKFASLLREMDGWQDGGPLWEYLARGMNTSGDKEASMLAKATRDMAELLKPLRDGGKLGGKGVFYPEIGMALNREELFMVALNAGNEGNLQRLMGGRNWQPEQVASLLAKMPPEFADMAQNVWDYFETLRPELGRVERALYGKEPEWVPATPVAIGGKTVQGGYFPIVYDPSESPDVKANMQAEDAKGIMRGALRSSSTRSGMTKSRAEKVNGQPVLLTLEGMSRGLNDTIHRIAWQEWVTDANRILRNKAFSSAVNQHYGDQVYDELVKAVQDIATGRSGDQASWAGRVFGHLRRGSSVVALGLNITNSLMNLSGLSQTAVRIGPRWMMTGVGQFAKSPVDATTMVLEKSVFMQNRSRTYNRELNEMVNTLRAQTKLRQGIDIASMAVQTVTQMAVDIPTWLGAYAKAQAAGETDARAAALADQAVIDAQSGGQMKDLAAIQRGGEFKKLLTAFYGYFSATYNLAVESTKKTDFKDPLDVVRLGRDYLLLVTVPAMWTLAVKEALTGGDDDEDELLKKVLAEHISYPMGMIVGVREFSPAVQKAFGLNTYSFGYGGPAGFRFLGELDKLGQQINQGEIDRALLRSASTVAGITLHLPTGQANKTIDGIIALSEGRTNNPLVLLGGAPPK